MQKVMKTLDQVAVQTAPVLPAAEGVSIRINDGTDVLTLDYDGAVCDHPGSLWWGTAVGFRAMQVAALALSKDELWTRENLYIVTGHPGPGVRDAINYITKTRDEGNYHIIAAKDCEMQCNSKMKYEWWVSDGRQTAFVDLRRDFVPVGFYSLSDRLGMPDISKDDLTLFRNFKVNLSTRIWNAPLMDNFNVTMMDPLFSGDMPPGVDDNYFENVPT